MTDQPDIWDHPTVKKWYAETVHMVTVAQLAEDTVAMIDERPARRATLATEGEDTVKVIYETPPPRTTGD